MVTRQICILQNELTCRRMNSHQSKVNTYWDLPGSMYK